MTPDPYLRNFALALGGAIVLVALLGAVVVAAIAVVLTAVIWGALRSGYARQRRQWIPPADPRTAPTLAERARLDSLVDRASVAIAAVGVLAIGLGALDITPHIHGPAVHSAAVALVLVAGGIYWSSLVDWFWTLPRVSGLLGHRSCRLEPEEAGRDVNWEEVTRFWLLHRMLSAASVSIGVGGIVATIGALVTRYAGGDPIAQVMVASLALVVASGAELYRTRAVSAFPLVLHPEIFVGIAFEDRDRGTCWPVDVALEGFKAVLPTKQNDRYLRDRLDGQSRFYPRKGDFSVALRDAQDRNVGDAEFSCQGCIGMNWYCLENPHAWGKGPRARAHERQETDEAAASTAP